jgi:hypothetical protein
MLAHNLTAITFVKVFYYVLKIRMMLRKAIEFGLYPWFPAYGYAYIHPANRRDFEALSPHGKVFEKISEDEKWVLVQYAEKQYKVDPDLFTPVARLPFSFGDLVETINRQPGQLRDWGVIYNIFWNTAEDQAYYQLRQGKKELPQHFRAQELQMLER